MILKIHGASTDIPVWKCFSRALKCGGGLFFLPCYAWMHETDSCKVWWLLWATNEEHCWASWEWTLRSSLGPFSRGNVSICMGVSAYHIQAFGKIMHSSKVLFCYQWYLTLKTWHVRIKHILSATFFVCHLLGIQLCRSFRLVFYSKYRKLEVPTEISFMPGKIPLENIFSMLYAFPF